MMHGPLSLRFDESFVFCFKMSHSDFLNWTGMASLWLWENFIFLTELCRAFDSISGVIKWWLTAWSRKRWFVKHFFYFKLCLQTKFHSQTDKEIWIELNQIEVNHNGKWSFFSPPSNDYHSILGAIIFQKGITNQLSLQCIVHFISAHWLIPLSSAVTVGLEWGGKAAWSWGNTLHIFFQSLIEYCR